MTHDRVLRTGAAAIALAVVLKIFTSVPLPTKLFNAQSVSRWVIYLETGRILAETVPATQATDPTPTVIEKEPPEEPRRLSFSPSDGDLVNIRSSWDCALTPRELVMEPLDWDLTGDEPTVLIYHTHAMESYTPQTGEDYTEEVPFRTADLDYNMVSIGTRLAELLENAGISVLHDTTLHDAASYNGSYASSRETVEKYLAQYPSIRLVLDIHRDAAEDGSGHQVATTAETAQGDTARLMLVLGSEAGGLYNPNWQENYALAVKLQAVLEQESPGLCRELHLTDQRYNQDLSPGALLIEVGAAGNSHDEALRAMTPLAEAIAALSKGAN